MASLSERRKEIISSIMRDAIYEAAVGILAKYGLAGATMDRVAALAGVAKGSLYNYFASKDDLLTFVYEKTIEPLRHANDQIAASDMAADEKLEAMIRSWGSFVGEHRIRLQVFIEGDFCEGVLKVAVDQGDQQTIDMVADTISQGIEAGQLRHVNARYAGEMLLMTVKAMFAAELAEKRQHRHEEIIETLISVFVDGLAANSTEASGAARIDNDSSRLSGRDTA